MEFVLFLLIDFRILGMEAETITADFNSKESCLSAAENHIQAIGDLPLAYIDMSDYSTWDTLSDFATSNNDVSAQSFRVMSTAPINGQEINTIAILTCTPK